jgi:hypothetical protein
VSACIPITTARAFSRSAGAERGVDPLERRGLARRDLGEPLLPLGRRLGAAEPRCEPVVAADDVHERVDDAGVRPALVLDERRPLGRHGHLGLRVEEVAERGEPLGRHVAAGGGPVAVRPLVVAGRVEERVGERVVERA